MLEFRYLHVYNISNAMYVYVHLQLMKLHGVSRELLPPKRYHGNLSKNLIDQRRLQLENYLQKLIHRWGRGEGGGRYM